MKEFLFYTLQVNVYLIGIILSYQYLLRKQSNFNFSRAYLLAGIGLSFLLPLVQFEQALFIETISLSQIIIRPIEDSIVSSDQSSFIPFLVISMYVLGFLLLFMKHSQKLFQIRALMKQSKEESNYYSLPNSTSAFSFFHCIFLGDQIPDKEKHIILKHEQTHYEKYHSADILLCHLLESLLWFNPLIYRLKNLFSEIHEYEVDAICSEKNDSYIDLLLKQSFNHFELSFIHQFNSTHLKQRIMRINNQSKSKLTAQKVFLTFAILCGLFLFNQQLNSAEIPGKNGLKNLTKLAFIGDGNKASFPGGQKALIEFMTKNLKYPKEIIGQDITEKVFIEFEVGKNGKVSNPIVKKGENEHLIRAAIAAVNKMPNWIPGEKDGKKVATKMVLPFKFVPPPPPPPAPEAPKG